VTYRLVNFGVSSAVSDTMHMQLDLDQASAVCCSWEEPVKSSTSWL